MINHSIEELEYILKNEKLNVELREAEEIYQRKHQAEKSRHDRYKRNGFGYILEREKSMNWSDRSKLDLTSHNLSTMSHHNGHVRSILKRTLFMRLLGFICLIWVWT